jgi:hypothetical protein
MSWSISTTVDDASQVAVECSAKFEKSVDALRDDGGKVADWYNEAEVREQFERAVDAARKLGEVVGPGPISVTLSGHANPEHRPTDGYANDCVTVSVVSLAEKPETVDEPEAGTVSTDTGTSAPAEGAGTVDVGVNETVEAQPAPGETVTAGDETVSTPAPDAEPAADPSEGDATS